MSREDARKLLGGYATGTLTDAEREALFSAALEDQELFDALMKEEALRETLDEPATQQVLLRELERGPERGWWRGWRPLAAAVAMAGLVLGGVAVWRGSREKGAPVTVAVAPEIKPATPVIQPPPAAPPAPAAARTEPRRKAVKQAPAEAKSKDTAVAALSAEADAAPAAKGGAAPASAPVPQSKAEVQQFAAQQATPPAPAPQQQIGQQQSIAVQSAPALNRVAAASGFRDTGAVRETALKMGKKVTPLLTWTILRGDTEAPPDTVIDPGETVRLRVTPELSGELALRDGEKVIATGQAVAGKPLDLGPVEPGAKALMLVLTRQGVLPFSVGVTLKYRE